VEAYTSTISNLTKEERTKSVFETYARDYNKLLEIFLNTYPAKKDYAPPTVEIDSSTGIVSQVFANYNEILTYTEQIKNLLEAIDLENIH
jgi:hypothetical protein